MSTTPTGVPEEEVLAGTYALTNSLSLPDWLQIPALGRDMRPIARLVVEAAAPLIAARVLAEERRRPEADLLARLCVALGEPMEIPADHPAEPPHRMTWDRALDLVRGKVQVWAHLLGRAEVADADWLNEYRRSAGSAVPVVATPTAADPLRDLLADPDRAELLITERARVNGHFVNRILVAYVLAALREVAGL